jgi:hypothetical protein
MNGAKEIAVLATMLAASATWTLAREISIIAFAPAEGWILLLS